MAYINSKEEFAQLCLRNLGYPVIEINLDDQQIDDAIFLSLQYYFEFHSDATTRHYEQYVLTQKDITRKYFYLPEGIMSVVKLFEVNNIFSKNLQFQAYISDIIDQARKGTTSNYLLNMEYLNTITNLFNHEKSIQFNRNNRKITIDTNWDIYNVGDILLFECFKIVDPDEFIEVYNDKWLIQYCTQRIKLTWASGLHKYTNWQLPSGITIDGLTLYNEAVTEIQRLEDVLATTYQYPVSMMIG